MRGHNLMWLCMMFKLEYDTARLIYDNCFAIIFYNCYCYSNDNLLYSLLLVVSPTLCVVVWCII